MIPLQLEHLADTRTNHREQATVLDAQASMMVVMSTAVSSLQATVVAQAITIGTLQTNVATATASAVSAASASFCGSFSSSIWGNAELERLAPHLRGCTAMIGPLVIQHVTNATALREAFQNLRVISGDGGHYWVNRNHMAATSGALEIVDCSGITSFGGIFPALVMAGNIDITRNADLASLGDAFPALETINGHLNINGNVWLATLGASFPLLTTITSGLNIYDNHGGGDEGINGLSTIGSSFGSLRSAVAPGRGGSLLFRSNGATGADLCASARTALCPTTTSWDNNGEVGDAHSCCTAYCETATDC